MTDEVIYEVKPAVAGAIGFIILDRPNKLNALSFEMLQSLFETLTKWQDDPQIKIVIIQGNGKGFCAGGDIKGIYKNGINNAKVMHNYFKLEYRLNSLIKNYEKPYIAIIDGVTMGGGLGISIHGDIIIGTENSLIAMPETGIGLFPDVGGSYFLSRLKNNVGLYMALTGARLKSDDACYINLINVHIKSSQIDNIIREIFVTDLTLQKSELVENIKSLINKYSLSCNTAKLKQSLLEIETCFTPTTLDNIFHNLDKTNSDWGQETKNILRAKSPTSLQVTLEQIKRGGELEFTECMQMEYDIVQTFLITPDLYEGIRAVLIDKDNSPKWDPKDIKEVTDEAVNKFFEFKGDII